MKRILWFLVFIVLFFPQLAQAKHSTMFAYGFTGGDTGDLDNISCTNSDNKGRDLETGDMAYVIDVNGATYEFAQYTFDLTENDSEDTVLYEIIVPDDRANCSTPNYGQWEKTLSISVSATATPSIIFRDSGADKDTGGNAKIYANCEDGSCTSASEDVDVYVQTMVNGALATVIHVDCDASGNCDVDVIPQGTGKLQVGGSQIDFDDMAGTANLATTGTISGKLQELDDGNISGDAITAAQLQGSMLTNEGASATVTWELPNAVAGLHAKIFCSETYDIVLDADSDDCVNVIDDNVIDTCGGDDNYVTIDCSAVGENAVIYTATTDDTNWDWWVECGVGSCTEAGP